MTPEARLPPAPPAAGVAAIPAAVVDRAVARLGSYCGLSFGPHNRAGLVEALAGARAQFGVEVADVVGLLDRPEALEWLVRTLTVGETYFFRIPEQFAFLRTRVVPELARARGAGPLRTLRAWSAGCASGEEAYSLAIAIRETLPEPDRWSLRVLGTDLNPEFLRRAVEGRYSDWSLRGLGAAERRRWFTQGAGHLAVREEIRRLVEFRQANLVQVGAPDPCAGTSHVDVLFCRNVFIYFDAERAARVASRLAACLAPGGYAFFGPSDPLPPRIAGLEPADAATPLVFRRSDRERERAVARPGPARGPHAAPRPTGPEDLDLAEIRRRAEIHGDLGERGEAGRWASAWVARQPESAEALLLLANVRAAAGGAEEAISLLRRALYFDPSFLLANVRLGELLAAGGRAAEARGCLTNALAQLEALEDAALVPGSRHLTAGSLRCVVSSRLASTRGSR